MKISFNICRTKGNMGLKNYGLQLPSLSLVQQVLRVNEKSELLPVMKATLRVFILDYFVALLMICQSRLKQDILLLQNLNFFSYFSMLRTASIEEHFRQRACKSFKQYTGRYLIIFA